MVARKSTRSKDKSMREREDLVRRSLVIGDVAKLLWIELCRGWAWDDKSARPSQATLGRALGWSPRKVRRAVAELVKLELITTAKTVSASNIYNLAASISDKVCDPERLDNRSLSEAQNGESQEDSTETEQEEVRTDLAADEVSDEDRSVLCSIIEQDKSVLPTGQICPLYEDNPVLSVRPDQAPKDEYSEDEYFEDESFKMSTSGKDPLDFLFQPELDEEDNQKLAAIGYDPDGNQEDYDAFYVRHETKEYTLRWKRRELSDKILSEKSRVYAREFSKRSSDPNLVGKEASGVLAEASSKARDEYFCVFATPPPVSPPDTPEDVLQLLHDEFVEKYGSTMARGVPLGVSKQEIGQLKTCILSKYRPEVVLAMVRVLVWDWEVARSSIFPKKEQQRLPALGDLVRYRDALAGSIATGLIRSGNFLGDRKSYSAKYVDSAAKLHDDDPF